MASKKTPSFFGNNSLLTTTLAFLVALAAVFALTLLVDYLPSEFANNPYLGTALRVWVFAVIALGAFVAWRIREPEKRLTILAVLLGVCFAGIVILGLKNTSYGLNGIGGDQGLQTAQVTKFANYAWVDFAYKDLPPFYPPAYFFGLGKAAALLDIDPYRMLKYGLIAIVLALPLLVQFVWQRFRSSGYVLAALLSLILYQDWYKPYEWLALVLFVPWWLYFVEGITQKRRSLTVGEALLGAVVGGLLFSTYYYWFFIGAMAILLRVLLRKAPFADRMDRESTTWKNRALVLGGTAVFSSIYWGPLLVSMARTGGWDSLQNRYFIDEFAVLQFPFLEISVPGFFLLGGLVYLVLNFQKKRLAFGLLTLLVAAYAWQLLGYVAFLTDAPLLTFKARDFVVYLLGLSALIGLIEWTAAIWSSAKLRRQYASGVGAASVIGLLFFGQSLAAGFADHALLPPANRASFPQDLINDYRVAVSDKLDGRVIWADGGAAELSIYLPVYQYLSWAAVFSHPAAQYYERVQFLQLLGRAEDAGWFAAALMNNRFSRIDEILLQPVDGGFNFGYLPENFPAPSETEHIFFPAHLFDEAYFLDEGMVGEFQMFSPRYDADPLAHLPSANRFDPSVEIPGLGHGDDFFEFLRRFGPYLNLADKDSYLSLLGE